MLSLRGKANIFRKSVSNKFSTSQNILFCEFEECEVQTYEVRGDLRLKQPRSHNFMALGQISLKISGNAYFDVH